MLAETLADLLHQAARLLRIGGHLVVFLPSLPQACMALRHAAFTQLSSCEQVPAHWIVQSQSSDTGSAW